MARQDKNQVFDRGDRKGAPKENVNAMAANDKGNRKRVGKSGNGRHKVGDGNNPFASALKKAKK